MRVHAAGERQMCKADRVYSGSFIKRKRTEKGVREVKRLASEDRSVEEQRERERDTERKTKKR